ncbi:terminase [Rhodococcus jostii]|uniref:terminase n=1 Tax=Rhodococcus jostii TaxID=132919 RepID=UPI00363AD3CF
MPSSAADRLATLPTTIPELTLGYEAAAWAVKYLRQPNGPKAGQRFDFSEGQMRFLLHFYAVNEDGSWVYHYGVRRLAKGSGKSPFAGVLSLIELCAPVRLLDFDSKALGGCKGKPVAMPWVQIAATSESQTANTMRMVRAFAPKGSRVTIDHGLVPGKTIYDKGEDGKLHTITASAHSAEGAEASFIVADETEWWLPANGGPNLHSTLMDNLAKSGSRMVETANAWKPGIGSVAENTWDDWVAQEDGVTRNESKILYDARMAAPTTDLGDEESLRAALAFVYEDCDWVKPEPIMTRIWSPSSKLDDSKRKYMNWPTAPEDSWADPQQWAAMAKPDRVVEPGERIVMFFDGSKSRDDTALVGCCMSDGHVFTLGVWSPGNSHDVESTTVDVEAVDNKVAWAFDTYNVVAFFADVREFESLVKITWPQRYRDQLKIWAVPGGKQPEAIAWDMRSHSYDFEMAAELAEAEIREAGFTHDGDPRLSKHVRNARRHDGRYGVSIKKETPNSPDKIDAAVCMIGARMAYRLVLNGKTEKERSNRAMFV